MKLTTLFASMTLLIALPFSAVGPERFHAGERVPHFGKVATVTDATPLPDDVHFKVAFDVGDVSKDGGINRNIESAARLLNMHQAVGVPPARSHVAIVVHGAAAMDLVNDERYDGDNPNAALVAALIKADVKIILCGQTAAYRDIDADDLLEGVSLSLSAMTAHALLQQQGYTLNPF